MLAYLDAFFAVAETLSFSKAARRLNISQPAISRQIRLLEESLGQPLFARNKHRVALTASGAAFRERVLPSYGDLLAGIKRTKEDAQEISGPIRVGCLREAGPFVELAMEFQKQHSGVVFQFEFLDNYEIAAAIRDGQIDFGIGTVPFELESLQSFFLYTQDSVVVTRGRNLRDLNDFDEEEDLPFVRYRFPTALHKDVESFFGAFTKKYRKDLSKARVRVVFAVNSHRSMAEVVADNDFYAVMPHFFVQKFLRYGRLRRVGEYLISKKIYLTHMSSPHLEARLKAFKAYLVDQARKIQRI